MSVEISKFFYINIEIEGKNKQEILVSKDTLIENIRFKIGDNIELIYNGNILDNDITIGDLGICDYDSIIYGFYTIEPKTQNLLNIFQNILELYTQPNTFPGNHYNNIINSMININSTNNTYLSNNNSNVNYSNVQSYDNELEILANMGFVNVEENILLLRLYNGDINLVTNILIGQ